MQYLQYQRQRRDDSGILSSGHRPCSWISLTHHCRSAILSTAFWHPGLSRDAALGYSLRLDGASLSMVLLLAIHRHQVARTDRRTRRKTRAKPGPASGLVFRFSLDAGSIRNLLVPSGRSQGGHLRAQQLLPFGNDAVPLWLVAKLHNIFSGG